MPLTPDQQTKADALVKAFGDFMGAIGGPYVAPAPAPGQGPGTFPVPAPAPVTGYWRPTDAQHAAFAARFGFTVKAISPVPDDEDATGTFPVLPPVTATADVLEYAGYGYGPDGIQRLFHVGRFETARAACDGIFRASKPGDEEAIVAGSEAPGVTPDAVRLSLLYALVVPGPLGNVQMAGGQTVADVVAIALGQNKTPAGQGPGGSR